MLVLLADVTFSDAAVAIVSAMLTAMVAAIVVMWRLIVWMQADRIGDLTNSRDKLEQTMRSFVLAHARCGCEDCPPPGQPAPGDTPEGVTPNEPDPGNEAPPARTREGN